MTWSLVVLAGLVIALIVLSWRWRRVDPPFTTAPAPASWGGAPDDLEWNNEATAIWHTELADVRGVAEKWGATVAALLGIFGAVAFATGPSALTDIPGRDAYVVLALILLAVVAAATATYCAAIAAQGTPTSVPNLNGWTLKQFQADKLPRAVKLLRTSRFLALAAILLIIGAVAVGWLAALDGRNSASPQSAVVVRADGAVSCGTLKWGKQNRLVLDNGHGSIIPLARVSAVTTVTSCP